ncbi:MAG: metal ABC transporter permease [Planctomycetota bacterium]
MSIIAMSVWDLLSDHTVRVVLLGCTMTGAVSGALGCFAYLRRQSLVGDVVSHSALLGIVLAFWIVYGVTGQGNRSLMVLMPGAFVAGLASLLLTRRIQRGTRLKEDAGLGVMLAIFFGTGMMILRYLQRASPPIPGRAGLDHYLFGMAGAMTRADLWMIAAVGSAVLIAMILTWSRLKIITFDQQYAAGLGLSVNGLEVLLLTLIVLGIVIGLQIVGVVLMISLLVAPAAAARQWTHSLGVMVWLAGFIGGVSGAIGGLVSAIGPSLPTGPIIVLNVTAIVALSMALAPKRGLVSKWRRRKVIHVD